MGDRKVFFLGPIDADLIQRRRYIDFVRSSWVAQYPRRRSASAPKEALHRHPHGLPIFPQDKTYAEQCHRGTSADRVFEPCTVSWHYSSLLLFGSDISKFQ